MDTLIHQRVRSANAGTNPTAVRRLPSGWVVLGDNQRLRGYCLLLSDPVAADLNQLPPAARADFLRDMAVVGDAVLEATGAARVNYMVLGNLDHALHAHVHPRYADEADAIRRSGPWHYKDDVVPFDFARDGELIDRIGRAIDRRVAAG